MRPLNSPYIIAEAGSCHEEQFERAEQLMRLAAVADCDAIKWQFWSNPARMRERRHVEDPNAYEAGSIHTEWMVPLRELAVSLGIDFVCTVYLPEDVPFVSKHARLKIASFEATDRELIKAARAASVVHSAAKSTSTSDNLGVSAQADSSQAIFVSTGMHTLVEAAQLQFNPNKTAADIILFHCVSAYPCPPEQANLGAIRRYGGYSDHTRNPITGACAVASGADFLEVHFRLRDTSSTCPDFVVALSPSELHEYVKYARLAAILRGSGIKEVQAAEKPLMQHRVIA